MTIRAIERRQRGVKLNVAEVVEILTYLATEAARDGQPYYGIVTACMNQFEQYEILPSAINMLRNEPLEVTLMTPVGLVTVYLRNYISGISTGQPDSLMTGVLMEAAESKDAQNNPVALAIMVDQCGDPVINDSLRKLASKSFPGPHPWSIDGQTGRFSNSSPNIPIQNIAKSFTVSMISTLIAELYYQWNPEKRRRC